MTNPEDKAVDVLVARGTYSNKVTVLVIDVLTSGTCSSKATILVIDVLARGTCSNKATILVINVLTRSIATNHRNKATVLVTKKKAFLEKQELEIPNKGAKFTRTVL